MTRICPRCGGNNTSKILWGMPAWTPDLEVELESKNTVLGGCCIPIPTPSHYCNKCKREILFDSSEEQIRTVYFEFEIGGYFSGYQKLIVENNKGKYIARYIPGYSAIDEVQDEKELTFDEYAEFIKKVYKCYFVEWKLKYIDKDVLDGTQWELNVTLDDGKKIKRYGSNAYPPLWNQKFLKAVNSLNFPAIK